MLVVNRHAVDNISAHEETDVEGVVSHDQTMRVNRFRVAQSVANESDAAIAALASALYIAMSRLTPSEKDTLVTSLLACSSSAACPRTLYELFHFNRRLSMTDHAW